MKLLSTILFLITLNSFSQDSVTLTITKVRTTSEKNIYWLKNKQTKERFITMCECKRRKGEEVKIAVKDLKILKEVFRKKDLEN